MTQCSIWYQYLKCSLCRHRLIVFYNGVCLLIDLLVCYPAVLQWQIIGWMAPWGIWQDMWKNGLIQDVQGVCTATLLLYLCIWLLLLFWWRNNVAIHPASDSFQGNISSTSPPTTRGTSAVTPTFDNQFWQSGHHLMCKPGCSSSQFPDNVLCTYCEKNILGKVLTTLSHT